MSLIEERRERTAGRKTARLFAGRDADGQAADAALLNGSGGGVGSRGRTLDGLTFSPGKRASAAPVAPAFPQAEEIEEIPERLGAPEESAIDIVRTRCRQAAWLKGSSEPGVGYYAAKRLVDIALSLAALVVLFPVLLLVGLAIVLEDGGPVLYYQERVGRDGKRFRFYKFRSMIRNADAVKDRLADRNEAHGPIFKMKNDPRITRVGRILRRSSIDELPQLMNVLRGEMSVVGPRPHLPREVERYTAGQERRLSVQPGLVCLREVMGRSNLTFDQWVELDLLYIENRSPVTDAGIMARLIPAVLKGEGAY